MNDHGTQPDATPILALRPAEAALACGISPRKLWALTADRRSGIPHFRLGRSVRYPVRELRDWLAAQSEKGGGNHANRQ